MGMNNFKRGFYNQIANIPSIKFIFLYIPPVLTLFFFIRRFELSFLYGKDLKIL